MNENPPDRISCDKGGIFVTQSYPVILNSENAGMVQVEKQGLYYRFRCVCHFKHRGMYEIHVKSGTESKKLGLCVPEGGNFILNTRIPIKQIPPGGMYFIAARKDSEEKNILPVCSEDPFLHLAELENAVYILQNNRPGIIIGSGCCHPKEAGFLDP